MEILEKMEYITLNNGVTHTCNGYTEQETGRYRGRAAACI